MNKAAVETYIETQMAPLLRPGVTVIHDKLNTHKGPCTAETQKEAKSWLLLLPPDIRDFNSTKQPLSKLKVHLRRIGARTYDELTAATGDVCALFDRTECPHFF